MAAVPREIVLAARDGDVNLVRAWLDAAPRNVNVLNCEAAGVVEAATGTQVLCARDIQPATRSALGATAVGRRLAAALDAGSLPRPTPGLLPRRGDGVSPVPCSFH